MALSAHRQRNAASIAAAVVAVLVGGSSTNPVTHYTHDNLGELLSVEDPNEALTSYSYNGLGQQVSTTAPDPTTLDGTGGPVTTYTFDTLGGILNTVAPQPSSSTTVDTTTTDAYDGFHRLASVADASGTTSYGYSDAGDQTSETDPDGNVTHWSYDDLHEQTGMTDPLGNSATYTYNLAGDLTSAVDRDSQEIDYAYDNLGRETTETWVGGGAGGSNYVIDTSYNNQGDVASASDSAVTYTYTTDHLGELTSVDDAYASATDVPDVVLNMGYDANGNRTSLDAVVGGNNDFQNTYSFDALDRNTEIVQQASTASGVGVDDNAVAKKEVDISYRANGQFDTISRNVFSGSTKELVAKGTYGYDDAERLTSLDYTQPNSTLPSFSWSYDSANQVHSFTSSEDGTATYGYDPTGQLTSAAYTALSGHTYYADNSSIANESNSFDANGNNSAATLNTGAGGVSTGGNQISTDGTWDYSYDNDGNLTSQVLVTASSDPNTVNEIDYTYDFRNRLTEVEEKNHAGHDLAVLDYVYDMYDELIGRTATQDTYNSGTSSWSGATTNQNFVFDPLNNGEMVLGFDGTGKITDRYLYGPAVDQILADETYSTPSAAPTAAGTTLIPLTDNEGSVRDVEQYNFSTNAADNVEHIVYNSFGAKLSDTGSVTFAFGNNGVYTDAVTADQLHGVRWFDPATQRWLTQDPAGLTFGTNPYVADSNSPTSFTDPSGLCPWFVPKLLCPDSSLPTLPVGSNVDADAAETILRNRDSFNQDLVKTAEDFETGDAGEGDLEAEIYGLPDKDFSNFMGMMYLGAGQGAPVAQSPSQNAGPTADDADSESQQDAREWDEPPDDADQPPLSPTMAGDLGAPKNEWQLNNDLRANGYTNIALGRFELGVGQYSHSFYSPNAASQIQTLGLAYAAFASAPFTLATDGTGVAFNFAADTGGGFGGEGAELTNLERGAATPRGFESAEQFQAATADLRDALSKCGVDDATIGVRGSSVTGFSFHTGAPFGPESDIDFFVESKQLTDGLKTSPNIPGFVLPWRIHDAWRPMLEWSQDWSEILEGFR